MEGKERAMTYYAHGVHSVEIDGKHVDVERLVAAWRSRGDADRERAVVEKLKGHLATRSRERDDAVAGEAKARDAFDVVIRSTSEEISTLRRERDEARQERDDERDAREMWRERYNVLRTKTDEATDVAGRRFWLVRRTTTVRPGEYGDVVVLAGDADDAALLVRTGGYNGAPLYGYRDTEGMLVTPLDVAYDVRNDDTVIVAETLR